MTISVGKRKVTLPPRQCLPEDVMQAVRRLNPPFVAKGPDGGDLVRVRRRVFLEANGVRVECEGEGELLLACKLAAEEHNQWSTTDDSRRVVLETKAMEDETERRLQEELDEPLTEAPHEEEDISIEEWGQLGYKWFRREDVLYV
jgi:hypothetical protein